MPDEESAIQRDFELKLEQWRVQRVAATEYARQSLEYSLASAQAMKEYGQQTLRAIFLINGGGIITTMTFVGAFAQLDDRFHPGQFVLPLGLFACGLVLCVIALLCGYLNFLASKETRSNVEALCNNIIKQKEYYPADFGPEISRRLNWTYHIAISVGVLSVGCFVAACVMIGLVFHATPAY